MSKLIIDGYNLGHKADMELDELIKAIAAYRRAKPQSITLCLDGGADPGYAAGTQQAGIQLDYSGFNREADDRIVELVRQVQSSCVVVTSDRGLKGRVEALGATVLSSEQFLVRLQMVAHGFDDGLDRQAETDEREKRREAKKKGNPRRAKRKTRKDRQRLKKV